MKIRTTASFDRDYAGLPEAVRRQADKQLVRLLEDGLHPSLRLKKMNGYAGIWEIRVNDGYRITLHMEGDMWTLRRIGTHDVLKNPL